MSRPIEEDELELLYYAAGALMVRWGLIEASINAITAVVFQRADGKQLEPELQLVWDRRLKFLRKAFRTLPKLSAFSSEAISLFDRLAPIVEAREIIAHCYLSEVSDDRRVYTFISLRPNTTRDMHRKKRHHVNMPALADKTKDAGDLALKLAELSERLLQTFAAQKPKA
jgi:hypothetical protein